MQSENKYKKAIKVFFISMFGLLVGYYTFLIFVVQILDYPIFGNAVMKRMYQVKDYINAKSQTKRRLIIVGDSNGLYGFNGDLIAKNTNFEPVNYASNIGFPLNYHIDKIISIAQENDIVVMSLYFDYYKRKSPDIDPTHKVWYVQHMIEMGDYRKYIDYKDIVKAYLSVKPSRVLRLSFRFAFQVNPNKEDPIPIMQQIWQKNIAENNPCGEYKNYNFTSLSPYGDVCGQENEQFFPVKSSYGLDFNFEVSNFFFDEFARLNSFAKSKNIKIILIYPPNAENELFGIDNPKTLQVVENLKVQLQTKGIKIYGDFKDSHFEQKYFFDSDLHLNKEGVILRTQNLIKILQELERKGEI